MFAGGIHCEMDSLFFALTDNILSPLRTIDERLLNLKTDDEPT